MNEWKSVITDPPIMDRNIYGWPTTTPVLAFDRYKEMYVVTREQVDEDCTTEWYTTDSERNCVTEDVLYWIPLPEPTEEMLNNKYCRHEDYICPNWTNTK